MLLLVSSSDSSVEIKGTLRYAKYIKGFGQDNKPHIKTEINHS